jgi:hypothetical protein
MALKKINLVAISLALLGLIVGFVWAGYSLRTVPPQTPVVSAPPEGVFCTQEAKLCPDGSYVSRTGPKCEFTPCPQATPLPIGYTLDSYDVAETLNVACAKTSDCETPGRYLVRSSCPYTSLCLQNKCTVVCPKYNEVR